MKVRIPRQVSISLIGLALNTLFNGIFLLQIANTADPILLTQSIVMWGGFFIAGACIAPFENYFLYRYLERAKEQAHGKIVALSSLLFLAVGISLSLIQNTTLWTIPLTLVVGITTGHIVKMRAVAIYQEDLLRVSVSNATEGLTRVLVLASLVNFHGSLTFLQILVAYVAGNIVSLLPYARVYHEREDSNLHVISISDTSTLATIGLLTSLITGGLPYLAGYFDAESIASILFFYVLSRSLLVLQSILVYVKPRLAKEIGDTTSLRRILKYAIPILTVNFILLSGIRIVLDKSLGIDLSGLNSSDLLYFALALVVSSFFTLVIASRNISPKRNFVLTSTAISLATACTLFSTIDSMMIGFYCAMVFSPIVGILALFSLEKMKFEKFNRIRNTNSK